MFADFSMIDEGKVPFLMWQMKNLGVSLICEDRLRGCCFIQAFLKGQGVPLHRNRAGHLTLNLSRTSAGKPRHQQATEGDFMLPAAYQLPLMSRRQLPRQQLLSHQQLHNQQRSTDFPRGRKCQQQTCTNVQQKEPPEGEKPLRLHQLPMRQ